MRAAGAGAEPRRASRVWGRSDMRVFVGPVRRRKCTAQRKVPVSVGPCVKPEMNIALRSSSKNYKFSQHMVFRVCLQSWLARNEERDKSCSRHNHMWPPDSDESKGHNRDDDETDRNSKDLESSARRSCDRADGRRGERPEHRIHRFAAACAPGRRHERSRIVGQFR